MNIYEAKEFIKKYIEAPPEGRPCIFLRGPPGIGKTSIIRQIGKEMGLDVIVLIASTKNPVDIEGIPYRTDGTVKWSRPWFLPENGKGIFFIDEINTVPKSMQVSLYGLALEGKIGEHQLPPEWIRIAAGNREEDMAVVYQMSSALITRMCRLDIEPSLDAWLRWAYDRGIHPTIIAFLKYRPDLLYNIKVLSKDKTFPTPRGYEMASWFMHNFPECWEQIEGCIGKGAAAELKAYTDIYAKIPDIDEILEGKSSPSLPDDNSLIYAVMSAIVYHCAQKPEKNRIVNAIKYVMKSMPVEFQIATLKEFSKSEKAYSVVTKTEEFKQFAMKHGDLFRN